VVGRGDGAETARGEDEGAVAGRGGRAETARGEDEGAAARHAETARGEGAGLGARLRAGDRSAAPAALNLLETRTARVEAAALVSAAGDGRGHIVGVTGPPGVGKSTLLSALLREWRSRGRGVAVLAVDPSSKRSGGSLLGDRARIEHDPADRDVFIRSMAAGERLGGLAPATRAAARALSAAFDVVVIETVGVGQSETDVAEAADAVAVVVQPGSGDALQFLKAGIMEVPDVLVVTKADLGASARRAEHDLRAALGALGARDTPVLAVSSVRPMTGIAELVAALDDHRQGLDLAASRTRARRLGALADFVHEHGERGLRGLGGRRAATRWLGEQEPGLDEPELLRRLEDRIGFAGGQGTSVP
jgi:LAO/AO transport system kinase